MHVLRRHLPFARGDGSDTFARVIGIFSRVVALSSIVALLGGCAISTKQRTIATYAMIGVALVGVGVYVDGSLSDCPPNLTTGIDQCEEDRHDQKNVGGLIAIGGLVASIAAQLWPVTDGHDDEPMVSQRVITPPPPTDTATATTLRDPAAVQLAESARAFAAAGKCVEAFGSLNALRRIDPELADQLRAWDPTVSRCRPAAESSPTALDATPGPSGPPSQTTPTPTPPSSGE